MNFRMARDSDVERLATLHADSWRRTYRGMMADEFLDGDVVANRLEVWRERLSAPRDRQFVLLAEQGSMLAGFVCVYADEDEKWGSCIDNLHVSDMTLRQGVGRELMLHAAEWLCETSAHSGVYLWVMEANARARLFYERLGAFDAGTSNKQDPGGGYAPNNRYVWRNPQSLLRACQELRALGTRTRPL